MLNVIGYDDLGRLTDVVYDNSAKGHTAYELDEHGNRKKVAVKTSSSKPCAIPPSGNTTAGADAALTSEDFKSAGGSDNSAPVADDEAVTVRTGQTLTVSPLVGDVDADGDQLIITAHDFEGEGQITYQVSDGRGGEDMGRIFVTVHSSGDTGGPGDGGAF